MNKSELLLRMVGLNLLPKLTRGLRNNLMAVVGTIRDYMPSLWLFHDMNLKECLCKMAKDAWDIVEVTLEGTN